MFRNPNANKYGDEEPDKELKAAADAGDPFSQFEVYKIYRGHSIHFNALGPYREHTPDIIHSTPEYAEYSKERGKEAEKYLNLAIESFKRVVTDDTKTLQQKREAMLQLGDIHWNHSNNKEEGVSWYQKAAEAGNEHAKYLLPKLQAKLEELKSSNAPSRRF